MEQGNARKPLKSKVVSVPAMLPSSAKIKSPFSAAFRVSFSAGLRRECLQRMVKHILCR